MRILFILFLLSFATLASADLVVKGKRVIYTGNALESGITLTEGDTAPANPALNDVWRDITDGTIYIWSGSAWVVKNATQDIKNEIAIFKANIAGVDDPEAKKCLQSLGKVLLKLYKEE